MTLGQKIAILRQSVQLSQEQLAEQIDVSRQSVSKWESDQSVPEVSKILQLSTLFNVTTDDLLRDEIPLAPTYTESLFRPTESVTFNGKYFGTDGFRGESNVDLTAEHAFRIGRFLGWYFGHQKNAGDVYHRARIVIGKDTRRSGYMLEYALAAGATASGADVYILHVITTPGVSYITRQDQFDCGVMISASHNPFYDNGIKLLNRMGEKMDDYTLSLVEAYLDGNFEILQVEETDLPMATRDKIGRVIDYYAGRNRYVGYLISVATNSFGDLNIGLDCANGASWMIAKSVFEALGAHIHVINDTPDGLNINEQAGSTHIGALRKFVRENHLDVGFAFDGDADRCIAVDENGDIVNGDHIIYILGRRLQSKGLLPNNTVVTTIMSNMGLYKALTEAGMRYEQTTVGDRFVYENMAQNGYMVGGEQSGHVIVRKYATTGDGLLTALLLTEEIIDRKTSLSKLAAPVTMYPQNICNVTVSDKAAVTHNEQVLALVKTIGEELGENGRILLRESGTEPVIRIMVESNNQKLCEQQTGRVADLIEQLGLSRKKEK